MPWSGTWCRVKCILLPSPMRSGPTVDTSCEDDAAAPGVFTALFSACARELAAAIRLANCSCILIIIFLIHGALGFTCGWGEGAGNARATSR